MNQDLISILIPFKNTELFLKECLNSIIAQDHDNWELLIVDDHSTDNSFELVFAFAEKDKRIKLLKNTGEGIIHALRLAFSKSKGSYITRMDSDDIMHSAKLSTMLADLKHHGRHHIALGLVKYFNENGLGDGYARYESWLNALTQNGQNYTEIYKECVIPSPCWMGHRDDLVSCGGFESNRYPEDYDLAFRFYKHKMACIPSQDVLHYWRDYNERTSRTDDHYAENNFLELKIDYFKELNYDASKPLVIWGAGQKGKQVAKLLKLKKIDFIWVCDNPKKIGKHIYDEVLYSFKHLKTLEQPQCIVTVANPVSQAEIRLALKTLQMKNMTDYFFFC
ncbi:MAG: glycosyltransferase family 2 protein [Psychroserpens sp.]|uniref:glycosyltransferase family 2 protein n=1 Tax=Psychroserpens sp. TaxID=2020870 RepID=UPI003CB3249F